MFPTGVALVFTAVFLVTGVYAFARYVRISTRPGRSGGGASAAELMHLLMSIAMIAMAWGWSGGPQTGSGIVQLIVFGLFGVLFVALGVRADGPGARRAAGFHALMAVAMVWMVATMPLLMGHLETGDDGGSGHAGHGGSEGADVAAMPSMPPAAPPTWAVVVTVAFAAALVVAAAFWVVGAVRAWSASRSGAGALAADAQPGEPVAVTGAGGVAVAVAPTAVATTTATDSFRDRVLPASCHALMSLGMAAMLLAML